MHVLIEFSSFLMGFVAGRVVWGYPTQRLQNWIQQEEFPLILVILSLIIHIVEFSFTGSLRGRLGIPRRLYRLKNHQKWRELDAYMHPDTKKNIQLQVCKKFSTLKKIWKISFFLEKSHLFWNFHYLVLVPNIKQWPVSPKLPVADLRRSTDSHELPLVMDLAGPSPAAGSWAGYLWRWLSFRRPAHCQGWPLGGLLSNPPGNCTCTGSTCTRGSTGVTRPVLVLFPRVSDPVGDEETRLVTGIPLLQEDRGITGWLTTRSESLDARAGMPRSVVHAQCSPWQSTVGVGLSMAL